MLLLLHLSDCFISSTEVSLYAPLPRPIGPFNLAKSSFLISDIGLVNGHLLDLQLVLLLLTVFVDENAHERNVDDGEDAEDYQDCSTRICSVLT